jgi:DNA-directed RNA polymerase specialized sigma24 family protein
MSEATDDFDAARFAEHWLDAEAWLRRKVAKFIEPGDVDDVMGEVAARMLEHGIDRPTRKAFVLQAETIAWRIAIDTRRRDRLGDKASVMAAWLALFDEGAVELADDVEHRIDAEAVMNGALAELLRADGGLSRSKVTRIRSGIELMMRGGPYSEKERKQVSRARAKLRDYLADTNGGVGDDSAAGLAGWLAGGWRRWRNLGRLRTPPPSLAALAGAVTATVLAGFVPSAATPATVPTPTRTAVAVAVTRPAQVEAVPMGPRLMPPASTPAVTHRASAPAAASVRTRPGLVVASTTTRLPSASKPGDVTVVVVTGPAMGQGSTTVHTGLYCDSALRRAVCSAVEATGTGSRT